MEVTTKKEIINKKICPKSIECGGCQNLQVPYEIQLKEKEEKIKKLLGKNIKVASIIGMENPFHYRNKVHAVFDKNKKGEIISGVYKAGTHQVVPVNKCYIENEAADEIIGTIRNLAKAFKISIFNEDTGSGLLRHVLVRRGYTTKEIMVVLVMATPIFPSKKNFIKELLKVHPDITTIVQNINNKRTSMVLGDRENVLYGRGYIEDELCGCFFRISSQSFYQVNSLQTTKLYNKAIELADLKGREKVIDAYCGIGTIGIIASFKAKSVIGVELNGEAVKDAISNAKRNKISNVRFYKGDAGEFMEKMALKGEGADVVIMDPPRSGSTEKFMDAIGKLKPDRVVYISCNPETLARDLRYMKKKGYEAKVAVPVDMFPMTEHVETICLLKK